MFLKTSSAASMMAVLALTFVMVSGCGGSPAEHDHEHMMPTHTPRSLWDLSKKIRVRLNQLGDGDGAPQVASELTDLIEWSAEVAADTDIDQQRWTPIYELSEELRLSIQQAPDQWDTSRREKTVRLCQLSEEAWRSLPPNRRKERYLVDEHAHHHSHGDHAHGDHDHNHGDHDHHDHETQSKTDTEVAS